MAKKTRSSRGGLSSLSVNDLHAELRRRQRRVGTLERKRDRLAAKLAALDQDIATLGGNIRGVGGRGGGGAARRRARNDGSLVEALAKTLDGKTMSVIEVAEAVQRAGYKTTSANFRTIVNQALINSGMFKRVERGKYTKK